MITITIANDGRVTRIGYQDKVLPKGAIEVDAIPQEPQLDETKVAVLYYLDGKLVWKVEEAEPTPTPIEPITPPIEPTPSELRRMAYEVECDPLLPSIQSYELQGKTEQLEAVKAEWYARHKEIEERYPNGVVQ